MRIVFMGSPDFAVPSLEKLYHAGFEIAGVVTALDKPAGRGRKSTPTAVKTWALAHDLPVLQPPNLKAPEFVQYLQGLQPDLQVVVAFRMLPAVVWELPPKGTINLHASLLPDYRGAAPINWAVIQGETETGVTTFFLQHEIDTGNIIFQERQPILDSWNAGDLYEVLKEKGAELVLKTVKAIATGQAKSIPQPEPAHPKPAPRIYPTDGLLDWHQPAEAIRNRIRGLAPRPGAYTFLDGRQFRILKAEHIQAPETGSLAPGAFQVTKSGSWVVGTGKGCLQLVEVQLEGRKRLAAADFARGYTPQSTYFEQSRD